MFQKILFEIKGGEMDFVYLARRAWKDGDFDAARMYYQKASYGIHGTNQANKNVFAQEVARFAGEDPLYQQGIRLIRQYIAEQNKPVLQSEMTAYVKSHFGEQKVEELRYVLYYAEVRKDICRRKQGRSYLLALSEINLNQAALPAKKAAKKVVKASPHLSLFDPNVPYHTSNQIQIDSNDIAELNREATRYKTEKNWEYALACLFKAKELTKGQYCDILQRLRLPLFLQQAGRFEAAKYELAYLLQNTDRFVALEAEGRQNLRLQKIFLKNLYLERLFDKARLIFQREKQNESMGKCAELSKQYAEKRVEANEKLRNAEEEQLARHRTRFSDNTHQTSTQNRLRDDTICVKPTGIPHLPDTPSPQQPKKIQKKPQQIDYVIGLCVVVAIIWLLFN